MSNYQVSWVIDTDADSPEEAAKHIWDRYGFSDADLGTATVLTVKETDAFNKQQYEFEFEDYEETGVVREV